MSYEKAGKIAVEAVNYGKRLMKEDELLFNVAKKVEARIIELGGKPAFPVQISLNSFAAHYCPLEDDKTMFKKGDLAKLDLGVHIEGKIADTAVTIEIDGDKHLELIRASKDALKTAVELIRPGVTLREVGAAIEEVIVGYGFKPIRNLSGHGLGEYEIHAAPTVPNYDNKSMQVIKEGEVLAVEPFATTGNGFVKDGKFSGIYELVNDRNVRTGREVLDYIKREFRTLPFIKRWIKDLPAFKVDYAIKMMERDEILHHYKQLVDRDDGIVSQAEHTVIAADKPRIITKVDF